jgi:hypothetical protein
VSLLSETSKAAFPRLVKKMLGRAYQMMYVVFFSVQRYIICMLTSVDLLSQ